MPIITLGVLLVKTFETRYTRKIHLTAAEADVLGRFLEDTLPAQLPKMELTDIHELTSIYKKLL